MGHDLVHGAVREVKDPKDHLLFGSLDAAGLLADVNHHPDLLLGDVLLLFQVVDAEEGQKEDAALLHQPGKGGEEGGDGGGGKAEGRGQLVGVPGGDPPGDAPGKEHDKKHPQEHDKKAPGQTAQGLLPKGVAKEGKALRKGGGPPGQKGHGAEVEKGIGGPHRAVQPSGMLHQPGDPLQGGAFPGRAAKLLVAELHQAVLAEDNKGPQGQKGEEKKQVNSRVRVHNV